MPEPIELPEFEGLQLTNDTTTEADLERMQNLDPRVDGFFSHAIKGVPAVVTESADILTSSLGLTDRGEITAAATETFPELGGYIERNSDGVNLTSTMVGAVLSSIPAMKVTRGVGVLGTAMKHVPGLSRITKLANEQQKALRILRKTDYQLARTGEVGTSAFQAAVQLKGLGGTTVNTTRKQLRNTTALATAKESLASSAVAEAVIYGTQRTNETLYSDNVLANSAWMLGGAGAALFIDGMVANHVIKRWLNSPSFGETAANALDKGGYDRILREAQENPASSITESTGITDAMTDRATLHFLAAEHRAAPDEAASVTLSSARVATATRDLELAVQNIRPVAQAGMPSSKELPVTTRFNLDARPDARHHILMAAKLDPTVMLGTRYMGAIADGDVATPLRSFEKRRAELSEELDELRNADEIDAGAVATKQKEYDMLDNTEAFVLRDMELVPVSDYQATKIFTPRSITVDSLNNTATSGRWSFKNASDKEYAVDYRGQVAYTSKQLQSMQYDDLMNLYHAADRMIDYRIAHHAKPKLTMKKDPTWFEIDTALEFMERGQAKGASVDVSATGKTLEQLEMESLAQKTDILRGSTHKNQLIVRDRLNLPKQASYERAVSTTGRSALDDIIEGIPHGNDIRNTTPSAFRSSVADYRKATDLIDYEQSDIKLRGNSFRLGKDFDGNPLEPMLILKRNPGPEFYSRGYLEERLASQQADLISRLLGSESNGSFAQQAVRDLQFTEDAALLTQTQQLTDLSRQGTAPFNRNRAAGTTAATHDWVYRDNPVMLAAQRWHHTMQARTQAWFMKTLTETAVDSGSTIENVFSRLRSRAGTLDSVQVNHFITARRGWDLTGKTVDAGKGTRAFTLENTSKNRDRWFDEFGTPMPKDATLPHIDKKTPTPLLLSAGAFDGVQALDRLGQVMLKENNTLLRAKGLSQIKQIPFYTPPRRFEGKFIAFIQDNQNVTRRTIVANTQADLQKEITRLEGLKELGGNSGRRVVLQDDAEQWLSLWERAYTGLNDPSVPLIQLGKQRKGSSQATFLEFNAWEEGLKSYQSQFNRVGRDTTELMFQPSLEAARVRHHLYTRGADPNVNYGRGKQIPQDTIHSVYASTLLGRNQLNNPASVVGRFINPIENWLDSKIASTVNREGGIFGRTKKDVKEFEQLREGLSEQLPIASAQDYIQQKYHYTTPHTVRSITGTLNKLTASVMLRWVESAQAILNVSGLVTTLPANVRHFTPREGETHAAYAARVGHSAITFTYGDGKPAGIMDTMKIMNRVNKQMFSDHYGYTKQQFEYMRSHGYLDQEVAEFQRGLDSMYKSDDALKQFGRKADKYLGMLSDKSEQFTRTYAHLAGLDIARKTLGISNFRTANLFAHDFANKVIANYNPLNRPEVFQSGLGSLIGLFQSYGINYFQRIFRYAETKDTRALLTQFAMQAGVFGMATVPGWRQFNDSMSYAYDGETSPYDRISSSYGPGAADIMLHGTLGAIPKLFGLDGVALYTRGDTSPRLPGTSAFPVAQVAGQLLGGMGRGVDMLVRDTPNVSANEITEVLAHAVANRPFRGMLELGLDYSTNQRGEVIARDLWERGGAAYRMLGLKPLRETKATEAFYRNKAEQQLQLAHRDKLLRNSRSAMRAGNYDELPDIIMKALDKGMSPAYIKSYVQQLIISAETPVMQRHALEVIKNPQKMHQVNRYLDLLDN